MTSTAPTDPLANPAATATSHPGLRHAPATARKREPIRQALADLLPAPPCTVLEIASGSGEHALWMARAFPQVTWIPSEAMKDDLAAIEVGARFAPTSQIVSRGPCLSTLPDRRGPAMQWIAYSGVMRPSIPI